MSEHTPTPWRFDGDWYRIPTIFGANGKTVASVEKDARQSTPERAANAAFIVKAVNNHDALVEALQIIIEANKDFAGGMPKCWEGDALQDACNAAEDLLELVGSLPPGDK